MRKIYRMLTAAVLALFVFCAAQGFAQESAIDPLEEKIAWIVDTYVEAGMSEYEKALVLHDWICENVQYDYQYYNNGACDGEYSSQLGVDGKAAILDGWAVCHGYAESYKWLLEEAGMEARYVTGFNHAWNIVKINGDWYHFDLTWDDGRGNDYDYDYFGLSDMAIHAERVNHGTQDIYRHLTCDSWHANYYYRNGYLDNALSILRSEIDQRIAAGVYAGTVSLGYSNVPQGVHSNYTMALILNHDLDWAVSGRVEITPLSSTQYDFVFYPEEELVREIWIDGLSKDTSADYYEMYLGYATQINVNTLPAGKTVLYESSDENVVTISDDGLVRAMGTGSAYITLTSGNCRKEYSILVNHGFEVLNDHYCYLDIGGRKQCELSSLYDWFLTDDAGCSWSSVDETVAKVDQHGVITGVSQGNTMIMMTTPAGAMSSVFVTVRRPVTAVVFAKSAYEVREGAQLEVSLHAEGCDQDFYVENFGHFEYVSSDETVIRPAGNYVASWNEKKKRWIYTTDIEIVGPGEATLTATAGDGSGVSGSCKIIVKGTPKLTSMDFAQNIYEATAGGNFGLELRTKANHPDYDLESYGGFAYTSESETVAVQFRTDAPVWNEEEGFWEHCVRLRCLAPGVITFTAAAKDGSGLSASCAVIVHSNAPIVLPAALKTIRDEAFLGTAAAEIVLPEGIASIGSRAFSGSKTLKLISLPESLESIAEDAFLGSAGVTIICSEGSEGYRFARQTGIPYIVK